MPFALLLAMQAAGMVVDYFGTQNQSRLAAYGAKIQQAGIEANIQQTRLETEDATLSALKNLRQSMGTQIAVFAARGTALGAGSAVSVLQDSLADFSSDERMRRMNLLGRENTLKAGGLISKLNQSGENSKLWQGFASRTINKLPSSFAGWGGGSGAMNASATKLGAASTSYGLTRIGG